MKTFQLVLGMLALLIVSTQTYRHAYVRWIEPRESVLTKFDKTEQQIAASESLEELVALYEEALKKVQDIQDKEKDKKEQDRMWHGMSEEPYKSERLLKLAIETWERHAREIFALHFFWWCGFASSLVGVVCYVFVHRWLGLVWLIVGFSEMIWMTSPSLRIFGAEPEFDRLLTLKFAYSVATWLLLLVLWAYLAYPYFNQWRRMPSAPPEMSG